MIFGDSHGDAIALAQARQAIKGKTDAAREMREAIEGRTAQRDGEAEEAKRIKVLIIDGVHRPNRTEIEKNQRREINVPGLTKPLLP